MNEIICGDCLEEMKKLDENSVDSIVTDPPYGLGFMGEEWDTFDKSQFGRKGEEGKEDLKVKKDFDILPRYDGAKPSEYQEFCYEWGKEALRVLKLGGYLLAFSGTRTYHRMVCGLENAGFEIKDQISWMYGSGFPKSHDISKAIDKKLLRKKLTKKLGHKPTPDQFKQAWEYERKVIGKYQPPGMDKEWNLENASDEKDVDVFNSSRNNLEKTAPATPEAEQWDGYGTALKPSHEPIVLAQKPREGTYAENVLEYGVGGLNIDGCRIGTDGRPKREGDYKETDNTTYKGRMDGSLKGGSKAVGETDEGRWPANIILDPVSSAMLDEQSGDRKAGGSVKEGKHADIGYHGNMKHRTKWESYSDSGGASRFFYCAKAHKSGRNAGLEDIDIEKKQTNPNFGKNGFSRPQSEEREIEAVKNDIATLKPINLMRYLVRLVTPPNGTVLDPFAGSGTTGCACEIEGFDYILIEKRERFANLIAPKRIDYWSREKNWSDLKEHRELSNPEKRRNKTLKEFTEEGSSENE